NRGARRRKGVCRSARTGAARCASQLPGAGVRESRGSVLPEGLDLGGARADDDRTQRAVKAFRYRRCRFIQGTILRLRLNMMTNVTRETWKKVMALSSGINLPLGPNSTDRYLSDPKRLAFFLSRYKFAAKMLKRCRSIADVG